MDDVESRREEIGKHLHKHGVGTGREPGEGVLLPFLFTIMHNGGVGSYTIDGAPLGQTITRLRKQQGLSQHALAQKAGVSRTILSRLETGQHNPTIDTTQKILHAINPKLHLTITTTETHDYDPQTLTRKWETTPVKGIPYRRKRAAK